MKKIRYGFVLLLMVGFFSCGQGMNSTSQPDDPSTEENTKIDISRSTYQRYRNEGVICDDVGYDDWKEAVERSYELEKILSNQHEFEKVYSSEDKIPLAGFFLVRGDVLITNGTSSAGFLGHAGIATSNDSILHISGEKDEPPKTISFSEWYSRYTNNNNGGWTKVYRHTNSSFADDAARWAEATYGNNSKAVYGITSKLWTTDVTYCSKIVWQAYHYGPSPSQTNRTPIGIVYPFDLPDEIHNIIYDHIYYKQ